jgi:hypothetical protein
MNDLVGGQTISPIDFVQAEEILRCRLRRDRGFHTQDEINWAIKVVQAVKPDHPYLRLSERRLAAK